MFPALPSDIVDAGVDVTSHACLLGYQLSNPPVLTNEDRTAVDAAKVLQPNDAMTALLASIKRRGIILDATLYAYETGAYKSCSAAMTARDAPQALVNAETRTLLSMMTRLTLTRVMMAYMLSLPKGLLDLQCAAVVY